MYDAAKRRVRPGDMIACIHRPSPRWYRVEKVGADAITVEGDREIPASFVRDCWAASKDTLVVYRRIRNRETYAKRLMKVWRS